MHTARSLTVFRSIWWGAVWGVVCRTALDADPRSLRRLCFYTCVSVHGGCLVRGGCLLRGGVWRPLPPPRWLLLRAVRILLECILVSGIFLSYPPSRIMNSWRGWKKCIFHLLIFCTFSLLLISLVNPALRANFPQCVNMLWEVKRVYCPKTPTISYILFTRELRQKDMEEPLLCSSDENWIFIELIP